MVAQTAAVRGRASTGKRKSRGLSAAVTVLSLALALALVGAGYFWHTSAAWKADSAAWEAQARRQAADVAELSGQLVGAGVQLSAMEGQLGNATNRITSLADEKAQLGDENAIHEQYLAQQQTQMQTQEQINTAATLAADRVDRCASGQAQLVAYYRSGTSAEAAVIEQFSRQVEQACTEANSALTQLRALLPAPVGTPTTEAPLILDLPKSSPSVSIVLPTDTTTTGQN